MSSFCIHTDLTVLLIGHVNKTSAYEFDIIVPYCDEMSNSAFVKYTYYSSIETLSCSVCCMTCTRLFTRLGECIRE